MISTQSVVFVAAFGVFSASSAMAQGACVNALPERVVQVAVANPVAPVMSHEVASLMAQSHKAQAQYRRTGSTQDLARVQAMRAELASRGFGRVTQSAPMADPNAILMASAPRVCQVFASAAF